MFHRNATACRGPRGPRPPRHAALLAILILPLALLGGGLQPAPAAQAPVAATATTTAPWWTPAVGLWQAWLDRLGLATPSSPQDPEDRAPGGTHRALTANAETGTEPDGTQSQDCAECEPDPQRAGVTDPDG